MMISSTAESLTLSLDVARALCEFAGIDPIRDTIAIGVESNHGVLSATDGKSALRFPHANVNHELAGKVWTRAHVEQLIRVAKASKASTVTLAASAATFGAKLPPVDQVVPERGFGHDAPCVDSVMLARIQHVVTAVHGPTRKGKVPTHGAHLASAKGEFDPLMFWVVSGEITVMAEIIIMPMRSKLLGALSNPGKARRAA